MGIGHSQKSYIPWKKPYNHVHGRRLSHVRGPTSASIYRLYRYR